MIKVDNYYPIVLIEKNYLSVSTAPAMRASKAPNLAFEPQGPPSSRASVRADEADGRGGRV